MGFHSLSNFEIVFLFCLHIDWFFWFHLFLLPLNNKEDYHSFFDLHFHSESFEWGKNNTKFEGKGGRKKKNMLTPRMFPFLCSLYLWALRDNPTAWQTFSAEMADTRVRQNTCYFVPPRREICSSAGEGWKIHYHWARNAPSIILSHQFRILPGKENTKMWKSIATKFCLHRNAEALQHLH